MGVIKRQSIKQSIVSYLAVAIAAISTIFVYPLEKEAYGLASFVLGVSQFSLIIALLGFNGITIRFFPQFREEKKGGTGFLFFIICGVLAGSAILVLLWFIFRNEIQEIYSDKPDIYYRFFPHIMAVAILMAFFQLFTTYVSNFKRIVVPAILQNIIKLSLPVLILLYIAGEIAEGGIVNGIVITYVLSLLLIIFYVYWLGEWKWKPDFSWFTQKKRKEIRTYALYSLAGGVGGVLAFRIDSIMISTLMDFKSNGTYNIAAFIGNAIAIPTSAILQISAPIISESFKKNDLSHVLFLYRQSSVNLLVIGFFLFVCIIVSVEDLFSMMPKSEEMVNGFMIVLLIGAGRIIDMATSVNSHIINYSAHFRFSLVAILFLAIVNICANYLLIPIYGIIGAAFATLISLIIFNLIKLVFIYRKLKMQPFTGQTVRITAIAVTCFLIGTFMPLTGKAFADILLRTLVITLIYIPAVYYFRISEELNGLIDDVLRKSKRG